MFHQQTSFLFERDQIVPDGWTTIRVHVPVTHPEIEFPVFGPSTRRVSFSQLLEFQAIF